MQAELFYADGALAFDHFYSPSVVPWKTHFSILRTVMIPAIPEVGGLLYLQHQRLAEESTPNGQAGKSLNGQHIGFFKGSEHGGVNKVCQLKMSNYHRLYEFLPFKLSNLRKEPC